MAEVEPKAAIIGWPVDHSRSPLIHRHWLRELGLKGDYERLPVAPDQINRLKALLVEGNYVGANVTIPHKEAAFRLADRADSVARELGAANTLWFEDGQLLATNTDGFGFLANLDERLPGWDRNGGKAVVLGAGGAARAIVWALLQRGFAPVLVLNRTLEKAENLARHFGAGVLAAPLSQAGTVLKDAGLVVNTTSVGMHDEGTFDFTLEQVRPDAVITDIVYTPLRTRLLREAAERNLRVADGLGMLLHQAAPGFEKWFGRKPLVSAALRQIILDDLGSSA